MIIILCDNCRRCEIITEINDKTGKELLDSSYQRYIKLIEIMQKMIGW